MTNQTHTKFKLIGTRSTFAKHYDGSLCVRLRMFTAVVTCVNRCLGSTRSIVTYPKFQDFCKPVSVGRPVWFLPGRTPLQTWLLLTGSYCYGFTRSR